MWNWIWIVFGAIAGLLLIEEASQLVWRKYLDGPKEYQNSKLSGIIHKSRQTIQKYRKDPSH